MQQFATKCNTFSKSEEPAELAAEAQMQVTERKGNLNRRAMFAKM